MDLNPQDIFNIMVNIINRSVLMSFLISVHLSIYAQSDSLPLDKGGALFSEFQNSFEGGSNQNRSMLLNDIHNLKNNVKVTHLKMNSDEDDFGVIVVGDKCYFTSSRESKKGVLNVWEATFSTDLELNDIESVNLPKSNRNCHFGAIGFCQNRQDFYFTGDKAELSELNDMHMLEIVSFTRNDYGHWSDPRFFEHNLLDYSVGHPTFSTDGNTMYFVSDMPGGMGGTDIYKSQRLGDTWSSPINMRAINTIGNELFPNVLNGDYFSFSSDGHNGYGGLDIFVMSTTDVGIESIFNAGNPINSDKDDFAMYLFDDQKHGYFSSNRISGKGDDDLYSLWMDQPFEFPKQIATSKDEDFNSLLVDKQTDKIMENTNVIIINNKTGEKQNVVSDEIGSFPIRFKEIDMNEEVDYTFLVEKESYLPTTISYREIRNNPKILMARSDLILPTNKIDTAKRFNFEPIYFDLEKYDIRPDAAINLDKIVVVLNENPNMSIELRSYTDCRGSIELNMLLSQKRSDAAVSYIRNRISNPNRISGMGYGEKGVLNNCCCNANGKTNCSESEYAVNRRTEFIVTIH